MTEPPEYTLGEVLDYLQIPVSRLTRYRRELADVVQPRREEGRLLFSAEQVELIRRRHLEHSLEKEPFLGVLLTSTGTGSFVAALAEAKLQTEGPTREEALRRLRRLISTTFADLLENPEKDPEALAVLQDLIRVNPSR